MHVSEPQGRLSPRQRAATGLQIGLTVLAFVFFYLGYLFLRQSLQPPEYSRALGERSMPAGAPGPSRRDARINCPWPTYPGAQVTGEYQIDLEPFPLQQQELVIAAPPERIVDFYRSRLSAKGFQDISDRIFNFDPDWSDRLGHPVSLQDERFVRGYDKMRRTTLLLERGEQMIHLQVLPGPKRWKQQVQLLAFTRDAPDQMAERNRPRELEPGSGIVTLAGAPNTWDVGSERYSTQFFRSRKGVDQMFARLRERLERDGWVQKQYGDASDRLDVRGAALGYFIRRNEESLLLVSPGDDGASSQALITTFGGSR
jgi:hypothetical protein